MATGVGFWFLTVKRLSLGFRRERGRFVPGFLLVLYWLVKIITKG